MTMTDPTHRSPSTAAGHGLSATVTGDRRNGAVSVVAIAGVIVLLVAGSFVWWRHWGPGHHSVAVLGDSITAFSKEPLESGLGFRYAVTVDGLSGARLDERVAAAQALGAAHPQDVVINLGTNDVLQSWNLDASMAALDQIGASFAGASCVAIADINENMAKPDDPGLHDRAVAFNARLEPYAAQHGWHLIDWSGIVAAYEQSGQPQGPISVDTVHPTEQGQQMLVSATYEALAGC